MTLSYDACIFIVTFSGNHAVVSGGIDNWQSSLALTDVTFGKNKADQYGAAMYSQESKPVLTNTIILGNTLGGSQMLNDRGVSTVTYSILAGGHSGAASVFRDADTRLQFVAFHGDLDRSELPSGRHTRRFCLPRNMVGHCGSCTCSGRISIRVWNTKDRF